MTAHTTYRTIHPIAASCMVLALAPWPSSTLAQTPSPEPGELPAVVITAQKRAEPAERVPAAVTSLPAELLRSRGATTALDLGELLPNVQTDRASGVQVTIRGVTSNDATEKGDPSVAFHVDGVYRARPQSLDGALFDIDRVEVLRGPQGTLWGRNATGGVIHVVTMKPRFAREAAVSLGVGDHAGRRVEGMLNLPLSEVLATRLAVLRERRDTVFTNGQANPAASHGPGGDNDETALRWQWLLRPGGGARVLLGIDRSVQRGGLTPRMPLSHFYDVSNPAAPQPVDRGSAVQTSTGVMPLVAPLSRMTNQGVLLDVAVPLGGAQSPELQWLWSRRTLVREAEGTMPIEGPFLPPGATVPLWVTTPLHVRWPADYAQQSHELKLVSPTGDGQALQWIAGLYAFSEDSHAQAWGYNVPNASAPGGIVPVYGFDMNPTRARSVAAFGDATWTFMPQWRASAGLRHTRDTKERTGYTLYQATDTFNPLTDRKVLSQARVTGRQTTWRAALAHDLSQRLMAWGSVATGYKAGSVNDGCEAGTPGCLIPVPAGTLTYRPETVLSWEAGLKGRWPERRLQAQASVFTMRYRDQQVLSVQNNSWFITNAARSTVNGAELETRQGIGGRDRIDLTLAWLDATYRNFTPAPGADWSGRDLDRSPRSRIGLAWQHTEALDDGARVEGGLSAVRTAHYVLSDPQRQMQINQPSHTKIGAQLAYVAPGARWRMTVFGRNLTNRLVVTDYSSTGNVGIGETRRWGVRLDAAF